jgi:hypothetical protein
VNGSSDPFTHRPLSINLTLTNLGLWWISDADSDGTISGNASTDSGVLHGNLNQTPLLFAFSNGTFTVSNFTFLSPGAPVILDLALLVLPSHFWAMPLFQNLVVLRWPQRV